MGFQTYTCCICGKEGLTKRNTYFIEGKGRACREHEQAKESFDKREEKRAALEDISRHRWDSFCKRNVKMFGDNIVDRIATEEFDARPEIDILQKLTFVSVNLPKLNEKQQNEALDKIFKSDHYLNYFHPHFDKVVFSLNREDVDENSFVELFNMVSHIDHHLDEIGKINDELQNNNGRYTEIAESLYKEIENLFMFIKNNKNNYDENKVKEHYLVFYKNVNDLVSQYENSPMNGQIKLLDKLSIIAKIIVRNLVNKGKTDRFSKYNIPFKEAVNFFFGLNEEYK